MQVQDWDEEEEGDEAATEEEELIRVQQEIERLRQEQESIMRRHAIAQRAEAHRQHINIERTRLAELQYTIDILCQQEQKQEPPLVQRQHQPNITLPPPPPHIPLPPLRNSTTSPIINHRHCHTTNSSNHLPHLHHNSATPTPRPAHQPFATGTMAFPLPSHTTAKIPWKHRPPQIPHVLQSHYSLSRTGQSHPHQISNHLSRGCCTKLVLQTPAGMYLLLATTQRKVPAQLPRFPSKA
jgi:hypothetical protein